MKVEIDRQKADELIAAIKTAKHATSLVLASALKNGDLCNGEQSVVAEYLQTLQKLENWAFEVQLQAMVNE